MSTHGFSRSWYIVAFTSCTTVESPRLTSGFQCARSCLWRGRIKEIVQLVSELISVVTCWKGNRMAFSCSRTSMSDITTCFSRSLFCNITVKVGDVILLWSMNVDCWSYVRYWCSSDINIKYKERGNWKGTSQLSNWVFVAITFVIVYAKHSINSLICRKHVHETLKPKI